MIDIQTYRSRIGSAPGMMDKILRRKATRFKSFKAETRHEDEDLLKKTLKTLTVFQFSYLLLVLLVLVINVTKVSISYQPLIKLDIHHVYNELTTPYLPSSFDITSFPGSCEHFMECAFGIFSIALCLSSIGAVHFISILLLIAGVEPNPGPNHKGDSSETFSSDSSDSKGCLTPKFFLTDKILNELSKVINDRNKLYTVGIHLDMTYDDVRRHYTNNTEDIKMAALDMLKAWHISSTRNNARDKLVEAFSKSGIVMPLHDLGLAGQTSKALSSQTHLSVTNPANTETSLISTHDDSKSGIVLPLHDSGLAKQTLPRQTHLSVTEPPNTKNPFPTCTHDDYRGKFRVDLDIPQNKEAFTKLLTNPLPHNIVNSLYLSGIGLTSLPDLRALTKLQILDISYNSIVDIQRLENSSLNALKLHGNPFEALNFDPAKVPKLENVTFGSSATKFVSFEILKRVRDDDLQLNLVEEYQERLLLPVYSILSRSRDDLEKFENCPHLPPSQILCNRSELNCYLEKPETCLSYINKVEHKEEALQWLLSNVQSFQTFSLAGQDYLHYRITFPGLEKILRKESIQNVTSLDLSGCGLTLCPGLDSIYRLKSLNINDNHISHLQTVERCHVLEKLFIVGNPVIEIRSETSLFENLTVLHVGSTKTKFISHKILNRKLANELELVVAKEYKKYLICPESYALDDNEQLQAYLSNPECIFKSKQLSVPNRLDALEWIVDKSQCTISKLDLSYRPELFASSYADRIKKILFSKQLSKLKHLNLGSCSLSSIDFLETLLTLEELNLSNNCLPNFSKNLQLYSLKSLNLTENPIEFIEVDTALLKSLETLVCGSRHTKCISLPILKLGANHKLNIVIPIEFRQYLILPKYEILDETEALREFVKHPEKGLTTLELPTKERNTIYLWLLDQSKDVKSLNLSEYVGSPEELIKMLDHSRVTSIETLNLGNCGLSRLPTLLHLTKLKTLSIENNNMNEITYDNLPKCLESISMAGNSLESVCIDLQTFKCLRNISCGSHYTKYIGFSLIRAFREKKIDIKVTEIYQSHLVLPPHDVLTSNSLLDEYLLQPEMRLQNVVGVTETRKALDWLLRDQKWSYDLSFSLSNQKELCTDLRIPGLEEYLALPELSSLKELQLDGCGLTSIPSVSTLSHLELLDLRNNNLSRVQAIESTLNFGYIRDIRLTGNPIEILDFEADGVAPSLKRLEFGSEKTKYISVSLLKALVQMKVQIVLEKGKDSLVFPPHEFICDAAYDFAELEKLCREPEMALSKITSVQKKIMFLQWLFNDPKIDFQSLRLSGQKDLMDYLFDKKQHSIFMHSSLCNIEKLYLNDCGITKFPILTHYKMLKYLNIADNFLTECQPPDEHKMLQFLNIRGNKIKEIKGNFGCFPSLQLLIIGSEVTEYISMELVQRVVGGDSISGSEQETSLSKVVIEVENDDNYGKVYKACLKMPPCSVLDEGNETLLQYTATPEEYLSRLENVEERKNALHWLTDNYGKTFKSFTLAGQKDLCDRLGESGLEKIMQKIPSVAKLNMSNCGLETFPDVRNLTELTHLDISENKLEELSTSLHSETLLTLSIQGNPIETIDVEVFKKLTHLVCGSRSNWRIDPRTIRKMADDDLKLTIAREFEHTLMFPPKAALKDSKAAKSYLNQEELDLRSITGKEDDIPIFTSLVDNAKNPIKSVRLSDVQCLSDLLQKNDFKDLINNSNIKRTVENLYIDNCDIKSYPKDIVFPNLKHVDMSNNKLNHDFESIPKSVTSLTVQNCELPQLPKVLHLEELDIKENNVTNLNSYKYPHLQKLSVDGNSIEVIELERNKFPELIYFSCGQHQHIL